MKVLLLGGTDLTLAILKAMTEAGIPPAGVVSLQKEFSISYNLASVNSRFANIESYCKEKSISHLVYQKDMDSLIEFSKNVEADFCLVAGWYFMLPPRFRESFSKGCAGLHASLLPQLRGAAPLNWAILKGLRKTGVSLFEISQGVDEGHLYAQEEILMEVRETITSLVSKVENASIEIVLKSLPEIQKGTLQPYPQKGEATYCCPRIPEDSKIDWGKSAQDLDALIRASSRPYAGAYTFLKDEKIIIWAAEPFASPIIYGRPGQIFCVKGSEYPIVICGDAALKITEATDVEGQNSLSSLLKMNYFTFSG